MLNRVPLVCKQTQRHNYEEKKREEDQNKEDDILILSCMQTVCVSQNWKEPKKKDNPLRTTKHT